MTPAELARLFDLPAEAGARAQAARAAQFGRRVAVRGVTPHPTPAVAALLRGGGPALVDLPSWSEEHVAQVMAVATGPEGQVGTSRSEGPGTNGQGARAMSDAAGPGGHGASHRSEGAEGAAATRADGDAASRDFGRRSPTEAREGTRGSDAGASADSEHPVGGDASGGASEPGGDASGGASEPGGDASGDPGWPEPGALRAGDRLVLQVDRARLAAYFAYLERLAAAAPEGLSVAPFCALPGGLMRLHLIAAARVALPGRVRVEARHDLLGIRLAQVALGFGADTLAGPLAQARKLPLAGVPRPDEATPAGLAALIERAGLEPVLDDMTSETLP